MSTIPAVIVRYAAERIAGCPVDTLPEGLVIEVEYLGPDSWEASIPFRPRWAKFRSNRIARGRGTTVAQALSNLAARLASEPVAYPEGTTR